MKVSTFPSISFPLYRCGLFVPMLCHLSPFSPFFPISLFSLSPTVYFPFSSILPPDTHTSFTSASATLLIALHWPYCWKNALTVTKAQNILKQYSTPKFTYMGWHRMWMCTNLFSTRFSCSCCCCCFCSFIHHAYILSDLIIHVKVSPRQLPSEASMLRW